MPIASELHPVLMVLLVVMLLPGCDTTAGSEARAGRPSTVQAEAAEVLLLGLTLDASGHGVVVGGWGPQGESHGVVRYTRDRGGTWTDVAIGPAGRLYGVAIDGRGAGVAVGLRGAILRTPDHGASWTAETPVGGAWLNGVATPEPGRFLVVGNGDDGPLLRESADGGATWQDRSRALGARPEQAPRAIGFSDSSHGWIVGDGGYAARTDDGGRTWRPAETGTDAWLRAVHFTNPRSGLIGGWQRTLWTDDGGDTWRTSELPGVKVNTVLRLDDVAAVAGTMDGTIRRTDDAGRTWRVIFVAPDRAHVTALRRVAGDRIIAIGDRGLVARLEID